MDIFNDHFIVYSIFSVIFSISYLISIPIGPNYFKNDDPLNFSDSKITLKSYHQTPLKQLKIPVNCSHITFAPKNTFLPPVIIYSFPGSGNTWLQGWRGSRYGYPRWVPAGTRISLKNFKIVRLIFYF